MVLVEVAVHSGIVIVIVGVVVVVMVVVVVVVRRRRPPLLRPSPRRQLLLLLIKITTTTTRHGSGDVGCVPTKVATGVFCKATLNRLQPALGSGTLQTQAKNSEGHRSQQFRVSRPFAPVGTSHDMQYTAEDALHMSTPKQRYVPAQSFT